MTQETQTNEIFNTGLSKIRLEIKSRLATHGLYGTVTTRDADSPATGLTIDVASKGKVASRSFGIAQIEGSYLRVTGAVLAEVIALVEELAA